LVNIDIIANDDIIGYIKVNKQKSRRKDYC
jgi:hypothetical protein